MFSLFNIIFKNYSDSDRTTNNTPFAAVTATKYLSMRLLFVTNDCYIVQVRNSNPSIDNPSWMNLSQQFHEQAMAEAFMNGFLNPSTDIGVRRLVFLESLLRHSMRNSTEHLFTYVRDLMFYSYTCHVKNKHIIDIQLISQLDDHGDEYFDCAYEVMKELFGNIQFSDRFKMSMVPFDVQNPGNSQTIDTRWPGPGMYDEGRRGYINVGSNFLKPLALSWNIDLNEITKNNLK